MHIAIAASEFFKDGKYNFDPKNPESDHADWISSDQLLEMYQGKVKYKVVITEDPFVQDDWEGYVKLTASTSIQIVADDLLVTNPKRIYNAKKKACNGLLQIGSVTEAIKAHNMAKAKALQISERLAKYNQLLRIEDELGTNGKPSMPELTSKRSLDHKI